MRIFTRPEIIPQDKQPCFMLWPLLNIREENKLDPDFGRFENYLTKGKNIHQLTDKPEEADAFVFPYEYIPKNELHENLISFFAEAERLKKPTIVFYNSDFADIIAYPGSVVFRTTNFRSERKKNDHGFPGWSIDFLKYNSGKFTAIPKSPKAKISYCGYIDYRNFTEQIRYKIGRRKRNPMYRVGPELRGEAVRALQKNNSIETDFILRNGFWAAGEKDKIEARRVYANNMLQSPYALVARGAGNFSYRLYEVLSCGRIPVFIDTDCVLPFDEFIDWKKQMLWIDRSELSQIAEKLNDFHSQIAPGDFEEMQFNCRKLYEDWIRPEAFFSKISLYIKTES